MTILISAGDKAYKFPYKHDPNEKKFYGFNYIPDPWTADVEVLLDTMVAPLIPNGFAYVCVDPGRSGAVEPTWSSVDLEITTDNTVGWQAIPYNLLLRPGEIFTSTWVVDNVGVTLDNQGSSNTQAWVRVASVAADVAEFKLTNHIIVTRADGKPEEYERSMIIKTKEL